MPPVEPLSPTALGRQAEQHAAAYLEQQGFTILDRNWRNRWCELDIVARQAGRVHIIEVKYRRRSDWGTGFEHISYDKAQRLRRAALAWTQAHGHTGPYQIDVINVAGNLSAPNIEHLPDAISD